MTVRDLINELSSFDLDMEVRFQQPTGNYWRQIKTPPVDEVEVRKVKYSSYLEEYELDDDHDDDSEQVVVIG